MMRMIRLTTVELDYIRMKRILILAALLCAATSAFAFDTKRERVKIGVLRASQEYAARGESIIADYVVRNLLGQLRDRGYDAFDAQLTYEDLEEEKALDADYYVEILGADGRTESRGGIGIGGAHVGVSVEMIVARVAAELRVYDADTLETIASEPLGAKTKAVLPTSLDVGIGTRSVWALIGVPLIRTAQYRSASAAVARQAATAVADALAGR